MIRSVCVFVLLAWYAHISTEGTTLIFVPFDIRTFVTEQIVILVITVALFVGYRRLEAKV